MFWGKLQNSHAGTTTFLGALVWWVLCKLPELVCRKQHWFRSSRMISSFARSLKRLMRSQGYNVEAFASAADFLASPRYIETACLIADVHMPAMTGIELYRHLIEAGYTIPTILVTAYPNDADRDRALKDGVVCYLRKPVDDKHLMRCLRAALHSGEPPEDNS